MKKIWIFHPYGTPKQIIGLTRPYDMGKELLKAGYDITIFSGSYLHYTGQQLIKNDLSFYVEKEYDGIKFRFIKTRSYKDNGKERILNFFDYYFNLKRIVKELIEKGDIPNLIYASSPHPLALMAGIQIAKRLKIKCIGEVRDFWPEVFFLGGRLKEKSILGQILLKGEKYLYKNLDGIIFLKEGDIDYIIDRKWDKFHGGPVDLNKIEYINNGVDLNTFDFNKKTYSLLDRDLEDNCFKVIYVGAIRKINNLNKILDVAKLFVDDEKIKFLIYGDGNEREQLEQRIKDEKISNVFFKGYVEKKYIPFILSKAGVNILNYSQIAYNWTRGNSSNKLFEYMASGKPIISTIKMGYSIIQKYKCGIELENDDIETFYNAIKKIKFLSDQEYKRLSENSRIGAEDFTYEKLGKKLIKMVETIEK